MKTKHAACVALATLLIASSTAWADDLRAQMEAANAEWLNAYNTMDGHALGTLYLKDAILLPPDHEALTGAQKIEQFWTDQIKGGSFKNHTWAILNVRRAGDYVIQVARFTVEMVEDGKTTQFHGNTVRVLQKQPDGRWLTAIHIFN